jgi:hypothetical protein
MNAKLTEMASVHCVARERQLLQVIALNERNGASEFLGTTKSL